VERGNVIPVHRSGRGTAALILTTPRLLYFREITPVPITKEAGWAPGPS